MTALTACVYVLPMLVAAAAAAKVIAEADDVTIPAGGTTVAIVHIQILLGQLFTTYVAFAGFAVTCLWVYFADVATMPWWVTICPGPMAKLASVFNPIFYVWFAFVQYSQSSEHFSGNTKLSAVVRKQLGLPFDEQLLKAEKGS